MNFSELTDNKQIFNYFVCIHYDVCKIKGHIIECKFLALSELSKTTIYSTGQPKTIIGNFTLVP